MDQAVSDGEGRQGVVEDGVLAAHARLLAGDRLASEELARLLLGDLVAHLAKRWPRWRHTDVLHDAAVDVFLDYVDAPERYDPHRGSLLGWLELAAQRDLANTYRSGKQRLTIDTPPLSTLGDPDRPADQLPAGATAVGMSRLAPEPDNADRLDSLDVWRRIREACPDEKERELIWAHWVEGEKSSSELAQIIGVAHLPAEQRRRKVKNACDVARRKLKRMGLIDGTD